MLIPFVLNPFHTSLQATNDCLPDRNFSWYLLTLLSKFSSVTIRELLSATFPDDIDQIVNLAEVRSSRLPPLLCCKYDGVPEERTTTLS